MSMKTYSILSDFSAVFDSGDDTKFICLESLFVMCTNDSLVQKNVVVTSY